MTDKEEANKRSRKVYIWAADCVGGQAKGAETEEEKCTKCQASPVMLGAFREKREKKNG